MNWLQRLLQPQQGQNMLAQPQAQAAVPMMDNASMRVAQAHGSPNPNMPQMPGSMAAPQAEQAQQPGIMDRFKQFRDGDRGQYLGDMFAGWAMGATPGQSLGMGAAMAREGRNQRKGTAQEQDRLNQTVEYLKGQGLDPDSAALVASNPQTLQEFLKQRLVPGQGDPFTLGEGQARYDAQGNLVAQGPQDPGYRVLSPQEAQQMGLPPGSYQMGSDNKISQVGGGGVEVNNIMGGEQFGAAFAKGDAQALSSVSEAGMAAKRNLSRIDRLESLLAGVQTGAQANFKQIAANYGLKLGDDVDNIQAAEAIINSLVPEQRPIGSGTMSDADLAMFKQSLPRIINQPGGNKKIIETMRAIAQYDAEGAAIVQALRSEKIGRAQAFEMLQSRVNPLAELSGGGQTQRKEPVVIDGYQIEVID
jgi:hypothetical protein